MGNIIIEMNKSLVIMALLGVINANQIPEFFVKDEPGEMLGEGVEITEAEGVHYDAALDTTNDMKRPDWGPKKMWCKKHPKECEEWIKKIKKEKLEWCKKNPIECAAWKKKILEKKEKWCKKHPKECAAINKKIWCKKNPTSPYCKKDEEDATIKRKLQEINEEEPEMYEEDREMPEDSEDFEDFEDSDSEEPEDFDHEEHMRGMRNHGQHIMERFQWGTQKILGGDDNQMMKHGKSFMKIKDGFRSMKKMFGGDDHDFKPHFKMPMLGGDDHDYKAAEMMEKRKEENPTVEIGEDGH